MSRFVLRVALRGEDLAALSAFEVLRENLGARDLDALARETIWEIDAGDDTGEGALARIETVARETLWTLVLPDLGARATLALARALAVTDARAGGLLANPHSQDVEFVGEGARGSLE